MANNRIFNFRLDRTFAVTTTLRRTTTTTTTTGRRAHTHGYPPRLQGEEWTDGEIRVLSKSEHIEDSAVELHVLASVGRVGWTWFCLVASSRLVASNEFGQRRSDHSPLPLPLYAPHYYDKYSYTTRERPWRS
jgi:hypothetical protein